MALIDARGVPARRRARDYFLTHNGRLYPPKYVVCLACKEATGRQLPSDRFGGGVETNSFLRNQGFQIVDDRGKLVSFP
jgi:hypothetical protein